MLRRSIFVILILLVLTVTAIANPLVLATVMGDCIDIKVIRKNGGTDFCQKYTMLYEGDKLQGSRIDNVEIKWHLNGEGKRLSNNELLIVGTEKMPLATLLPKINDFLETVSLQPALPATTNIATDLAGKRYPLPGFKASLLPGEPVSFVWPYPTGRVITFNINKGPEVFRRNVIGVTSMVVTPEELNLKPFQDLSWHVVGMRGSFIISLVDGFSNRQILQDLQQIDEETGDDNYKKVKKAAYLQLVSDVNPDSIDLYWKSHNILQSVPSGTDRQLDQLVVKLDYRMEQQLDKQFRQSCGACHGHMPQ